MGEGGRQGKGLVGGIQLYQEKIGSRQSLLAEQAQRGALPLTLAGGLCLPPLPWDAVT